VIRMKKLLTVFSFVTIAAMILACGVYAKGMECKQDSRGIAVPTCTMAACGNCENGKICKMAAQPSGAHINDTPSIKEMQSKPCPKMCYKTDSLGSKVASQTDNSGKNYLGR